MRFGLTNLTSDNQTSHKIKQTKNASQSSLRILMRQDTTTIRGVSMEFNLSEWEENFLLTCERGDALIIADQNHVAVKVVASSKEHPLITTNPAELY
jgi:hypothetical protein